MSDQNTTPVSISELSTPGLCAEPPSAKNHTLTRSFVVTSPPHTFYIQAAKSPNPPSASKKKPAADPTEAIVMDVKQMITEHQSLSSKARTKALMSHILAAADKDTKSFVLKSTPLNTAIGFIDRAYLYLLRDRDNRIDQLTAEMTMMRGGFEVLKQETAEQASNHGSLEEQLKAATDRIQRLESDNRAMLEDLQRAEYAAAAATSECLALQEAAAGIAVADSRRQKIIAMRLAELKDELRKTKHQLRNTRLDEKRAELGIMKLESNRRAMEHEAATLRESLTTNGVDLELLEAQRRAPKAGTIRQPHLRDIKDPEARLHALRQPASYSLFAIEPVVDRKKSAMKPRRSVRGVQMMAVGTGTGKENH